MELKIEDKYQKVVRAYQKLKKCYQSELSEKSHKDAEDAAEMFFLHCYHFSDWLIKKYPELNIRDFILTKPSLQKARAYTNTMKHGSKNNHGKKDNQKNQITNDENYFILTVTEKDGKIDKALGIACLYSVIIDGVEHDSFDLATKCLNDWNDFLENNNIKL